MKIKDGYILKNIAGSFVVIPLNETSETESTLISLNETGAFLWQQLETDTTTQILCEKLLKEFDTDEFTARNDIAAFLNKCKEIGVLE